MILFPYLEFNLCFLLSGELLYFNSRPKVREPRPPWCESFSTWVRAQDGVCQAARGSHSADAIWQIAFFQNSGSIESPVCHLEYTLCDNPWDTCCSTLGPDSGKSSCEGMWMSWEFENTQTDRVSDSELKGKGVRPIPATELGCKTESVQHREVQVPAGSQGFLSSCSPSWSVRVLLVQSRKRDPRSSIPGTL